MVFLVLFCIPLLVLFGAYLIWKKVTWQEAAIQIGVQAFVAGISALLCYCSETGDTEVWNGVVTGKERQRVSCSHSYSCNCRQTCTGSGNNRSCSQTCDTCYDHPYDFDWEVYTSNNETIDIDRVDRQGVLQPPRWTAVKMGEPTSTSHRYTSYIKGAPDTLFRRQGQTEKYKGTIPAYPEVFDYYRIQRFIPTSVTGQNEFKWNEGLNKINAELGHHKQVNMLVVLTQAEADWFYALEEVWLGGKKNDVVLVIGVDADAKPKWANVMAWTNQEMFKVQLRDAVLGLDKINDETVLPVLRENVASGYVRKPMAEFEYLKASITPSAFAWTISLIIGVLISVGMTWFFHTQAMPWDRTINGYRPSYPFKPNRFSRKMFG